MSALPSGIRERKLRTLEGVETFGERLARLRAEKGMTATELAFMAQRSAGWLAQVERGEVQEPSFQVGIRLARALGVTPEYLAFGAGPAEAVRPPGDPLAALQASIDALTAGKAAGAEAVAVALADFERRLQSLEASRSQRRPGSGAGK